MAGYLASSRRIDSRRYSCYRGFSLVEAALHGRRQEVVHVRLGGSSPGRRMRAAGGNVRLALAVQVGYLGVEAAVVVVLAGLDCRIESPD